MLCEMGGGRRFLWRWWVWARLGVAYVVGVGGVVAVPPEDVFWRVCVGVRHGSVCVFVFVLVSGEVL